MAHRLIWAPAALEDIDAIAAYIARDSRTYSGRTVRRIRAVALTATRFPTMGRVVPEIDDPLVREVLSPPYRVIYRVGEKEIGIAAVIHGARDLISAIRNRDV